MSATPTKKQDLYSGLTSETDIWGAIYAACIFTANANYLMTGAKLYGYRTGTLANVYIALRAVDINNKPTGLNLITGSANSSSWSTSAAYDEVDLTAPYALVSGTKYALVVWSTGKDGGNCFSWYKGTLSGFWVTTSADSGNTWASVTANTAYDCQIWGVVPPTVTTQNALNLTATSVLLQGTIDVVGDYSPLYARFDWGLTTAYGNSTNEQTVNPATVEPFNATITGLVTGTTYHFRAVVRYI